GAMAVQRRVLVAAQPGASAELVRLLDDTLELVPAYTRNDAFRVLEHEAGGIQLILATIAFDDSRMIEFLQAVKAHPQHARIPFVCTRVLAGVLSDGLVVRMR